MQGNKSGLPKILTNKNTVTIFGFAIAFVILFFAYNIRVNKSINPQTIPYAKVKIEAGTKITADMIGTMQVPPAMITDTTLQNQSDVIDHYSNADTIIPKGSLFYERSVVNKEELPASIIYDIEDGEYLFNLTVDSDSTYGNLIYPGSYIDIDVTIKQLTDSENQVDDKLTRYGTLFTNVEVIQVQDSAGNNVFADLDNKGTPSRIIFALPYDDYVLLTKIANLSSWSANISPRPTNEALNENPEEYKLSDQQIADWVNQITAMT